MPKSLWERFWNALTKKRSAEYVLPPIGEERRPPWSSCAVVLSGGEVATVETPRMDSLEETPYQRCESVVQEGAGPSTTRDSIQETTEGLPPIPEWKKRELALQAERLKEYFKNELEIVF